MNDLIEQLKKATAPSRQLDGLIFKLVGDRPGDEWHEFEVGEDGDGVWYRQCRDDAVAYECPPTFTSSIDAALTLKPDGFRWYVADGDFSSDDRPVASVYRTDDMLKEGCIPRSVGTTPAIAICIAVLRARAALPAERSQGHPK